MTSKKTYMATMVSMFFLASHALGHEVEEKPTTSYVHYACEENADFFSFNSLDYDTENQPSAEHEGLFLNSTRKEQPETPIEVTQCKIADMPLTLTRVFLNVPDNSGNLCATLDWAVFQLRAGDTLISEFISGCSDEIHIFTTQFNLHVCKSDFNQTACKSLSWTAIAENDFSPIRIGLLGDWL